MARWCRQERWSVLPAQRSLWALMRSPTTVPVTTRGARPNRLGRCFRVSRQAFDRRHAGRRARAFTEAAAAPARPLQASPGHASSRHLSLPVLRRGRGRSACSLSFKPILSKRADCRSSADGSVHADGGLAVEKDDFHQSRDRSGIGPPRVADLVHLISLVERRSRACSFENAEVGLESDERELRRPDRVAKRASRGGAARYCSDSVVQSASTSRRKLLRNLGEQLSQGCFRARDAGVVLCSRPREVRSTQEAGN